MRKHLVSLYHLIPAGWRSDLPMGIFLASLYAGFMLLVVAAIHHIPILFVGLVLSALAACAVWGGAVILMGLCAIGAEWTERLKAVLARWRSE